MDTETGRPPLSQKSWDFSTSVKHRKIRSSESVTLD